MSTSTTTPPKGDTKTGADVIDLSKKLGKDYSRADRRWSKPVMARGYTIMPALLIRGQRRLGLSPEQFNVLVHLVSHWWEPGSEPYPTKKRIANRMGKSQRQVQRYLTELEQGGFIARRERFERGRGQVSNAYALGGLVLKLKAIEPDFTEAAKEIEENRVAVEQRGGRRAKPRGASPAKAASER